MLTDTHGSLIRLTATGYLLVAIAQHAHCSLVVMTTHYTLHLVWLDVNLIKLNGIELILSI